MFNHKRVARGNTRDNGNARINAIKSQGTVLIPTKHIDFIVTRPRQVVEYNAIIIRFNTLDGFQLRLKLVTI